MTHKLWVMGYQKWLLNLLTWSSIKKCKDYINSLFRIRLFLRITPIHNMLFFLKRNKKVFCHPEIAFDFILWVSTWAALELVIYANKPTLSPDRSTASIQVGAYVHFLRDDWLRGQLSIRLYQMKMLMTLTKPSRSSKHFEPMASPPLLSFCFTQQAFLKHKEQVFYASYCHFLYK